MQSFYRYENSNPNLTNAENVDSNININININNNILNNLNQENDKSLNNSNNSTAKVEIFEDCSVCIKNTSGMISPSYGAEYKNLNHDNDNELLANSKLLISNNIKALDDDLIDDVKHNINHSLYDISPKNEYKNCLKKNLPPSGVYYSSIKKNKINKMINEKKENKSEIRKKVIIDKNLTKNLIKNGGGCTKNNLKMEKNNAFCQKLLEQETKDILNQWKYFANKLKNNFNNKENIFHSNLTKKISLLKNYVKPSILNFSINNNNNKNIIGNIFTTNDNYNNYIRYIDNNNESLIKNQNSIQNSIQNSLQNSIQHSKTNSNKNTISIRSIENNNNIQQTAAEENEDMDFLYQPTNIDNIVNISILNNAIKYENTFNEIILLAEEEDNDEEEVLNKDQQNMYSIKEDINESSEDYDSVNDNKSNNKIIKKISVPEIDKNRIKIWNKFNNIIINENINKNNKDNKLLLITQENSISFFHKNKNIIPLIRPEENDDISISISESFGKTETEISDDETIDNVTEQNGLIKNNNMQLFLKYIINNNTNNNKLNLIFLQTDDANITNNNIPKFKIKIKSYLKILNLLFISQKRKPISRAIYEKLILSMINNLSCYKNKIYNNNLNKINSIKNDLINKEKLNNDCYEMDKKLKLFEDKIAELKNRYIYTLIKKHYIKDKNQKNIFIKQMNISNNRNEAKKLYKEVLFLMINKINDNNLKKNYYEKIKNILKNYEKINSNDLYETKNKVKKELNNENNKNNKNNESNKNNNKIIKDGKRIFSFLLPVMFIANYFMNNNKPY